MPPIRNSSVARGQITTTSPVNIYTIPDGYVLLLKDIRIFNQGSGTGNVYVSLSTAAGGFYLIIEQISLSGQQFGNWSGWLAMNAGDQLGMSVQAPPVSYWVSGALLPFVPGF